MLQHPELENLVAVGRWLAICIGFHLFMRYANYVFNELDWGSGVEPNATDSGWEWIAAIQMGFGAA